LLIRKAACQAALLYMDRLGRASRTFANLRWKLRTYVHRYYIKSYDSNKYFFLELLVFIVASEIVFLTWGEYLNLEKPLKVIECLPTIIK